MNEQKNNLEAPAVKKAYEKPKLTKLGTVQDITQVNDDSNSAFDRGSS